MKSETIQPQSSRVGREYDTSFRGTDLLMEVAWNNIGLSDKEKSSITNFAEYAAFYDKRAGPTLYYDNITNNRVNDRNVHGVIYVVSEGVSGFDFFGKDGEVVISEDTKAVELAIPKVDFVTARESVANRVITPKIVSDSLDQVARFLTENPSGAEFVFGLTHSRMGKIAQSRWGFKLSENPFLPLAQKLFDLALEMPECDQVDRAGIQGFRNQVLVYQPMEEFLQRAS